tara:strand:+ start:6987 stop:7529 length:543 start_codon:yes stop_codon:yes gene_type:complete
MVWTKRPTQKINEKGVSSQWEGTHMRFEEKREDDGPRKKWHIGTGANLKENYGCALQNSCGYISSCTEDYVSSGGSRAPGRTKKFNDFIEKATEGDIIFLHYKKVTHWGIYSGKILSHREGYDDPDHIPNEWSDCLETGFCRYIFHIKVERWVPLTIPFKGAGENKTLYEVSDRPEYKIQ